jgi:TRAP-type C4-dicarboxylate transport system permease large subunit
VRGGGHRHRYGDGLEAVGILLLQVPVFLPALIAVDVDLIWFGIVVVLVV